MTDERCPYCQRPTMDGMHETGGVDWEGNPYYAPNVSCPEKGTMTIRLQARDSQEFCPMELADVLINSDYVVLSYDYEGVVTGSAHYS